MDKDKTLEKVKGLDLDYWKGRFEVHDKRRVQSNKELESNILFLLDGCLEEVYDQIYSFYGRYAKDGIVPIEVASVRLDAKELSSLIKYLNGVLEEAGLNGIGIDLDVEEAVKDLSETSSVTRIEGLILKLKARIELVYETISKRVTEHLKRTIDDSYATTIYEVFSATGYGTKDLKGVTNVFDEDDNVIPFILLYAWRTTDETYDDVVWRYKREMEHNVEKSVKQNSFLEFEALALLEAISSLFRRDNKNLKALVETDSTFYSTHAQVEAFGDLQIEEALYCTIDDERRTEICAEADGNIIPVDEIEPWVNAPPLHYGCRSWLTPIITKVDYLTGETYEVADEDYDTWYSKYL